MAQNINIPTPQPHDFNFRLFGYNSVATNGIGTATRYIPTPLQPLANAAIGQALMDAAPQVQSAAGFILHPGPAQIISNYLRNVPPAPLNTMPQFEGAALDGSPIYANLEILAKNWTDMATGAQMGFDDMSFNTVLISLQQSKNIIETHIQGSDKGAVLEYSGLNNYNITINIIVTGTNGIYPQDSVENIKKMLTCPTELSISSWYLNTFDIYNIVIKSYDINQAPGSISQQAITIQAQSTNTTTLIIQ